MIQLKETWVIRCPECSMLIQRVDNPHITRFETTCYSCENIVFISDDNIEKRIEKY
jgi:hypothetical protein